MAGTPSSRPFMLLLVGIPGSGKSHFASRLETESTYGTRRSQSSGTGTMRFVRVNQDALGSRQRCVDVARTALSMGGTSVVIDRCNFDVDQRRTWIELAREMNVDVECVIFVYGRDVCIERCRNRRGHETIHPSDAARIVSKMAGNFRPPIPQERFRRVTRVTSFRMSDDLVDHYLGYW
jgi:predicted kinase